MITTQNESERARAWFNSLDFDAIKQKEATATTKIHNHTFTIFFAPPPARPSQYYLFITSPQQRAWNRPGTYYGQGDKNDLAAGLERFIAQMEAKQARHDAQVTAKCQARTGFINPYKADSARRSRTR